MKIKFLGAAHEVTGSCTLLTAGKTNILIDCGMEQGPDIYENEPIPVLPSDIDVVLLTHAHIDHSGKLPLLTAGGYEGKIYATSATAKLCGIMLLDSAHIQEFEAEWRNRKAKRSGEDAYTPLYTTADAQKAISLFAPCEYGQSYDVADGVRVTFFDAGHLLGSSSIAVTVTEGGVTETVLFSGDLGNVERPLIKNPQVPCAADYVVIESTYGDRLHGEHPDYAPQLAEVINRTFRRGGNVVIPSFAVGRTQELLYIIRNIKENNMVPDFADFAVWIDSPLGIEATNIYSSQFLDYYDDETRAIIEAGVNPISFNGLRTAVSADESKLINEDPRPKVIISASGMCEAGRIKHHLKHNLWRSQSTILFVGYQSAGTLGRLISDGAGGVSIFGEFITVKAEIVKLDGISSHADRDMLTGWLAHQEKLPRRVFVNHGDNTVSAGFADHLCALGYTAEAPYNGAEYDLIDNVCVFEGNRTLIDRDAARKARAGNAAFERLRAVGRRLTRIIDNFRGAPPKDIARLTGQITSLCDKYERKK